MRINPRNAQLGFENLMPAIALMSPAFWIAWIEIIYSGEVYGGSVAPSSVNIIMAYIGSTTAMALALIAYGFKPVLVHRIVQKPWWIAGAGTGAALATWIDVMFSNPVAVVLTGVFTSLLIARFAFLLAQLKPKEILLAGLLLQIVAAFIYGYVLYLPSMWRPLFLCLLPLLAAGCSLLDGGRLRYDGLEPEGLSNHAAERRMVPNFIRLVIAIGLFAAAINIVRGFYPAMIEMDTFAEARGSTSVLFFFVKVGLCLLVVSLPLKANLSRVCYWSILALAFCTLLLPLFGMSSSATLQVFGCINGLQNIVVWTLLCSISYKSGRNPIRIFCWGWGVMALCSVVGWVIGIVLYAAGFDDSDMVAIEIVMLAVMLTSGVIVINQEVVNKLFRPIDAEEDSAVEVSLSGSREMNQALEDKLYRTESVSETTLDVTQVPSDSSSAAHRGRWRRAVAAMAADRELSERERDVLELLLKGYSKNRVADELCVSYNTVRSHVRNIYTKTDAHCHQDLIDLFDRYLPSKSDNEERDRSSF